MKPVITKECVKNLFDSRYIHIYDLQYAEGKHYFDASRRSADRLTASMTDDEFKSMLPDAVSCIVILNSPADEPRLLLSYEYRYPVGRFLLSIPAGLIDPEDAEESEPLIAAAKREIEEETGLVLSDNDTIRAINPLAFSTPGMSDESNALICAVLNSPDMTRLSQTGAVGTELFDGFLTVTKTEATKILRDGRDPNGNYYSMYTWAGLMYFVSDMWKDA